MFTLVLHPLQIDAMSRASAREQWYAQHRENRIAKREGIEPGRVTRLFKAEQGVFMGVRIIESKG